MGDGLAGQWTASAHTPPAEAHFPASIHSYATTWSSCWCLQQHVTGSSPGPGSGGSAEETAQARTNHTERA